MVEFYSYTSHIKVVDVHGMGIPNLQVSLSSSSPISVNINEVYSVLRPDETFHTSTNSSGAITIIEETQTLAGTTINVTVRANGQEMIQIIDPHENACQRLSTIESYDGLRAAT
ncbi:hypothetical protein AbraCBS73388_000810, partial [Aspergillus brasiliensis]